MHRSFPVPPSVLLASFLFIFALTPPLAAAQCVPDDLGYEGAIGSGLDSLRAWLAATAGNDCCRPFPTVERGEAYLRLSEADRKPFLAPKVLKQVELNASQRGNLAASLAERGQAMELPAVFTLLDLPGVLSGYAAVANVAVSGLMGLTNSLTEARRLSLVQLSGVVKASSGWLQYVAWVWPGGERMSKGYFFSRRDGDKWQHFYLGGVNFRLCK